MYRALYVCVRARVSECSALVGIDMRASLAGARIDVHKHMREYVSEPLTCT